MRRKSGKRTTFDIEWLDEWLSWLDENKYLFVNYKNGVVDGVITMFPISKYEKLPSVLTIIKNIKIIPEKHDFYIMDALVDNSDARVNIIASILKQYPEIESDKNCQILACINSKVKKLDKNKLLILKK